MKCPATCVTGLKCKKKATHGEVCWVHSVKEMNECGICLDETLKTSKYNIKLDCGHIFCIECIFTWIVENNKDTPCPCCRKNINTLTIIRAQDWGIKKGLLYYCDFTFYPMSKLDDIDNIYVSAVFNCEDIIPDELYKRSEATHRGALKAPQDLFDKLKNISFSKRILIKKNHFNSKKLHMFIY